MEESNLLGRIFESCCLEEVVEKSEGRKSRRAFVVCKAKAEFQAKFRYGIIMTFLLCIVSSNPNTNSVLGSHAGMFAESVRLLLAHNFQFKK